MDIPSKYRHNIEPFINKSNFKNVILSCYMSLKKDPIHAHECNDGKQTTDNFEYIKLIDLFKL